MKKLLTMQFNPSLKFPLLITRSFYTIDSYCSLQQIFDDIDYIYQNRKESHNFNMSENDLCNLKAGLLSGFYHFSPLRCMKIKYYDLGDFVHKTLPFYPDLKYLRCKKDSSSYVVVLPSKKEDGLVFMALGRYLYRVTYGSLSKDNSILPDRLDIFYSNLKKMGKVTTRLYQFHVDSEELHGLSVSEILEGVKSFVGADSFCYRLVYHFINLRGFDEDGNEIRWHSMPLVGGDITGVLLNMYLTEFFDRRLCQKYPGIVFERFMGLVFILCPDDLTINDDTDECLLLAYEVFYMLEDIGLYCHVKQLPGDGEPLDCLEKMVDLDNDGFVIVYTDSDNE